MSNRKILEKRQRMEEIEDRKIEILIEIAKVNKNYDVRVTQLNYEYEQLHKEHYQIQMQMISNKRNVNSST